MADHHTQRTSSHSKDGSATTSDGPVEQADTADREDQWLSPEEEGRLAGAIREFPGYLATAEDGDIGTILRAFDPEGGVLVVAADDGARIVPASAVARVDHGARTVALRIRRDRFGELPRWDDNAGDEQVTPGVVYAAALVLLDD
jgi:hypothetical protein